jgi:hypothetical protein
MGDGHKNVYDRSSRKHSFFKVFLITIVMVIRFASLSLPSYLGPPELFFLSLARPDKL